MAKQEKWYVWDSRGGSRNRPTYFQTVNFDLEENVKEWKKMRSATVTGSIESGRLTYRDGVITCELWREDQPNPTPYTKCDNPDPIDENDPARTWIKK